MLSYAQLSHIIYISYIIFSLNYVIFKIKNEMLCPVLAIDTVNAVQNPILQSLVYILIN